MINSKLTVLLTGFNIEFFIVRINLSLKKLLKVVGLRPHTTCYLFARQWMQDSLKNESI